jgi:hypothetical protein
MPPRAPRCVSALLEQDANGTRVAAHFGVGD